MEVASGSHVSFNLAYYQESGRAGRDRKTSRCIVLYKEAEVITRGSLLALEKSGISNGPQSEINQRAAINSFHAVRTKNSASLNNKQSFPSTSRIQLAVGMHYSLITLRTRKSHSCPGAISPATTVALSIVSLVKERSSSLALEKWQWQ